jgi:hypothetical protein|tara:strand:- start:110 stop:337 length:228 start_codon:yes stop_codon:yes gene_type:complete
MTDIDQYRLNRIDQLIEEMGVQERARNRERVDKDKKIKELQETILAYSERVNMYELKVGKLRRTIGEYIDKYGLQ